VIEVACGLSPRGWRFAQRYGERPRYIEADLPDMAARKRAALKRMGSLTEHHQVSDVDALQDDGCGSLAGVAAELDPGQRLAIITERLLGYLPTDAVERIWRRSAGALSGFPTGRYISDLHLGGAITPPVQAFRLLLSAFVRGGVYLHFDDAAGAAAALRPARFATAQVRPAVEVTGPRERRGSRLANILEASTN
jgi:Leucine carboxyl methyltransferase